MLSELALVDWIALLIALVLLCVAGVATYLARVTDGSGGMLSVPPSDAPSYKPSHASSGFLNPLTEDSSPGLHAVGSAPSRHVPTYVERAQLSDGQSHPPLFADPEFTNNVAVRRIGRAQGPDEVIDLASDREETVGDRAKRLRSRPIAEPRPAQIKVAPAYAPLSYSVATTDSAATDDEPRTPGFFDDPLGRHELRYWNGEKWTEYVKEGSERFIDPL